MNSTGKKARRASGLNRHQIHFSSHSHKSAAKVKQFAQAKRDKVKGGK